MLSDKILLTTFSPSILTTFYRLTSSALPFQPNHFYFLLPVEVIYETTTNFLTLSFLFTDPKTKLVDPSQVITRLLLNPVFC